MKKIYLGLILGIATMIVAGGRVANFASAEGANVTDKIDVIDPEKTQIVISAINPGYTIDGAQNTGELIEITKLSENLLSLTGLSIYYTNGSGTVTSIYDFPEGTVMTGESLLLRYAKSPEVINAGNYTEVADAVYSPSLGMTTGPLEITFFDKNNNTTISSVCWTGKEGCVKSFDSKNPSVLVRDKESGNYTHVSVSDFLPSYDKNKPGAIFPTDSDDGKGEVEAIPHCQTMQFSELFTYYEGSNSEQFIELYNNGSVQVNLSGCSVRYKNKVYGLNGIVRPQEFFAFFPFGAPTLTKDPSNSNLIEIIDEDGSVVDKLTYYNGQKKGVSLAMFGYNADGSENWLQTYNTTPGAENDYQKYKTCESGKVLNEETGNCVKASNINTTLAACAEGYYRNPLTNRCKKAEALAANAEVKPCAEGYERNPATNRCRKIVINDGAAYPLAEVVSTEEKSEFIAVWAIAGVAAIGAGYVIYQYREEIFLAFSKVFARKK